jgi:Adenine-specific DNA methylase containing a Zn-ribbon
MSEQSEEMRSLKVESVLPVKSVGIECLKESNPEKMSPHRYLFKWFARRPTAATRLAVLASVLPEETSNDSLLELMQIGPERPEQIDESISEYVLQRWATKDSRDGRVSDHFGYPIPHSQSPTSDELDVFQSKVRDCWGGQLPTVLDPTAGGGTIPLESLRYGLPTVSNELNPVAWLLNKVILDYAKDVGSIEKELNQWADRMQEYASQELADYYPAAKEGQTPNHYLCTYSIECSSCGYRIPLANRWWFKKKSANEGHAIRPHAHEDRIEYEYVELPTDVDRSEFNPDNGVVESGDAECLNCGVVTERERIKQRLTDREFEYEVCGAQYKNTRTGKSGYRGGNQSDKDAVERAKKRLNQI